MALALQEISYDHRGRKLPNGLCAYVRKDNGELVGFKARWLTEDDLGHQRQPSKSFAISKLGSPDRALDAASFFLVGVDEGRKCRRASRGRSAATANDVFAEWRKYRAPQLSPEYAEKAARFWEREIATRAIGGMKLEEISADPSLLVRAQDEIAARDMKLWKQREIGKLLKAVLRWGRRRHPKELKVEVSGLIELPSYPPSRLAYAADAIGLERVIEAVLTRPAHDDLLPLRDAAFVAAMGFTVASRPSEWRLTRGRAQTGEPEA